MDEPTQDELNEINRLEQRQQDIKRKLRRIQMKQLELEERDKDDLRTVVEQGHTCLLF